MQRGNDKKSSPYHQSTVLKILTFHIVILAFIHYIVILANFDKIIHV